MSLQGSDSGRFGNRIELIADRVGGAVAVAVPALQLASVRRAVVDAHRSEDVVADSPARARHTAPHTVLLLG
jgi:hypothetical protein